MALEAKLAEEKRIKEEEARLAEEQRQLDLKQEQERQEQEALAKKEAEDRAAREAEEARQAEQQRIALEEAKKQEELTRAKEAEAQRIAEEQRLEEERIAAAKREEQARLDEIAARAKAQEAPMLQVIRDEPAVETTESEPVAVFEETLAAPAIPAQVHTQPEHVEANAVNAAATGGSELPKPEPVVTKVETVDAEAVAPAPVTNTISADSPAGTVPGAYQSSINEPTAEQSPKPKKKGFFSRIGGWFWGSATPADESK